MRALKVATSVLLASFICIGGASISAFSKPAAKPVHKAAPANASQHGSAPSSNLGSAYNAYLNRLRDKLEAHWLLPDGKNDVQVSATVGPDGGVTGLEVKSSPSSPAAEQAATDAFNQSQPLEALPSTSPSVKLVLNFISTADPHGDSNRQIATKITPLPPEKKAQEQPAQDSQNK